MVTTVIYENKKGTFLSMFGRKKKRYKKIFEACRKGDLATVCELSLHKDIDIHDQNEYALRLAAMHGHLDIVQYLIKEHDADVHISNEIVLDNAISGGWLDVVKYLIEECEIDVSTCDENVLNCASYSDQLDVAKYLVEERGVDVHANNEQALRYAVCHRNLNIVKYLVEECGANIHLEDEENLYSAARWGYLNIAEYLVKQGANIERLREYKPDIYIKALDWRQEYRMKQGAGWQKTGAEEVGFYEEKENLSREITKIFNFKAKEITTISRNTITDAESLFIQAFDEVRNQDIIAQAYAKLKEFDPKTTVKYSVTNNMVRIDKRPPSDKIFKVK